jgi:hypothetical protein
MYKLIGCHQKGGIFAQFTMCKKRIFYRTDFCELKFARFESIFRKIDSLLRLGLNLQK